MKASEEGNSKMQVNDVKAPLLFSVFSDERQTHQTSNQQDEQEDARPESGEDVKQEMLEKLRFHFKRVP